MDGYSMGITGIVRKGVVTTYSVYQGLESGVVKYVGITARNPAVRFAEHQAMGGAKSLLDFEVIKGATNLTRIQARIMEQNLINQYGFPLAPVFRRMTGVYFFCRIPALLDRCIRFCVADVHGVSYPVFTTR